MTTPSDDKRAARRDARKANLATTQSGRGGSGATTGPANIPAPANLESVTFTAGEEPVVSTSAAQPTSNAPARTTSTRPTTTGPVAAVKTAGAVAGTSKPVTNPTANGATYKPPPRGSVQIDTEAIQTKRDFRRETRRADLARVQIERKKRIQAAKRKEFGMRLLAVVLVVGVVALLGILIYNTTQPAATIKSGAGHYGNGITCGAETTAVHYHAHLQFVVNGKLANLPDNVGISASQQCLYWLHVHPNDTGVVHIEAPDGSANRVFYLGDFMAVWKHTPEILPPAGTSVDLNTTSFFGLPVDKQHPLTVFVDGRPFLGDPLTVPLKAHTDIWVEYGTQLVQPTPFTFSPNE